MKRGIEIALAAVMVLSLMGLGFVGCQGEGPGTPEAPSGPGETPEVYKLKLSTFDSSASWNWEPQYLGFKNAVEEDSDGRILIDLYPSSSLLSQAGTPDGLIAGVADIGVAIPSYNRAYWTLEEIWTLPPLWSTAEQVTMLAYDLHDEYFEAEYTALGLHDIAYTPTSACWIASKVPIDTVEDFQGMTFRAATSSFIELMDKLGAVCVPMAFFESYEGLQKGIFDASVINPVWIEMAGWYEVAKNIIDVGGLPAGPNDLVMSLATYESLPADLQKVIDDRGWEFLGVLQVKQEDERDIMALENMEAAGCTITVWPQSEMERLTTGYKYPMWDDWAAKIDALGLPGTELVTKVKALAPQYVEDYPAPTEVTYW